MAQLDRLVWAAKRTYHLGPLHLGVRVSDAEFGSALAESLTAHLVPDVVAPSNYSILMPDGKHMGILYRGHVPVVRMIDDSRLQWATLRHLSSHLDGPAGLALDFDAVVRGDEAVLAPRSIAALPRVLSRDLQQRGYQFLDATWVDVDPARGELQVSAPTITWEPGPLRQWMGDFVPVPAGSYRVAGILFEVPESAQSPSNLFWLAQTLLRSGNLPAFGPERAIDELLSLLDRVSVHRVDGGIRDLATAVIESFDGLDG